MLNKILIALDHSPLAEEVFEQGLAIAQASGGQLLLVHILSGEEADSPEMPLHSALDHYPLVLEQTVWDSYQEQWQAYEQRSLQALQRQAKRAEAVGVSVELSQRSGVPEHVIGELARTWQADVIVMGNRGHRGLRELFLGSVSNYVTHHAPCSVLVVRGEARRSPPATQAQQTREPANA
jgi:nucleotide-binding universal stress UspA family protein